MDRNRPKLLVIYLDAVALRKESVDRNADGTVSGSGDYVVALRKESVDRNIILPKELYRSPPSLSARRAWIEMKYPRGHRWQN